MRLYLIRHGRAEDDGPDGSDRSRRLTAEGAARFVETVNGMRDAGVVLDRIFTSPLVRARETAALLARHLPAPEPEILPGLGIPAEALGILLEDLGAGGEAVAAVGHEPTLGHLASFALFGRATDATPLRKGGVACLEFGGRPRAGGARLAFLTPARLLRRQN
jgi:phosphohistidine phosphatase